MKEHFWDEIGNHSSKELLEKYFPGKVYENAAIQKNAVEFCQIAEKIVGLNKTQIPFLVESQLSSIPETYHDPGRRIIGKKYITDADASKAGACQKCLEHAKKDFQMAARSSSYAKTPFAPQLQMPL